MSTSRSAIALLAALPAIALGQVVINPTGGTGPGAGVRVYVGPSGQVQVLRNGTGQFYSQTATPGATTNPGVLTGLSNGVYLAVGTANVFGPQHFAVAVPVGVTAAEFTPISNTLTPQANGSGTATTVLRATVGGRNYDVSVRYDYVFPNDFVSVTHTVTIPPGNTLPIRLYHGLDAFLGGDDTGPSFFVQGPPTVVGGFRQASNVVLAWRYRGGVPWTGYYGGFYECMFRDALCPMGMGGGNNALGAVTFNNWIDATVQDNGFAIMWNFGSAPATQIVSNDLTFFSYQPTLTKAFGTTAISAGSTTTLTFTIDNVPGAPAQGNLGFQDTLPANLLLANTSFTNTCNGTVTLNNTVAPHSIRLQSGTLAPLTQRCSLTVTVTANVPGAYVNGRSNIGSLSVIENQVSDQTLSVVQSAPIVTLDAPGIINLANATTYPVSGTCQATAGMVTVSVGSVVTSTACSAGSFSTSMNVAALADGPSITVSASQTNCAGTGSTSRPTSKDTTAPGAPVFTAPADGSFSGTATPTISGTAEAGSTVRVISGGVTVCTALTQGNGVWTCTTSTLPEGVRSITTVATDPAGNASVSSGPRTITVDTTAPIAPVINSPVQGSTVGPSPTISGTAEAFATVTVTEGAGTICTVAANNLGQWSCATTFGPSMHAISATQRDQANNASPAAPSRTFTIANVPTVTLTTPGPITAANAASYPVAGSCTTAAGTVTIAVGTVMTTTGCNAGAFTTSVNVSSLADAASITVSASQMNVTGTGTDSRSTRKDTAAPTAPTITFPPEGSRINTQTPTITGTGEAGAALTIRRGATTVCTVTVPSNGLFSCVAAAIPDGPVTITATATDAVGNTSPASPARNFTVDTTAPNAPVITNPAQNATVGINPTLAGTAEPGATVSVSEGSVLICSVTADASGQWSCPTSYQPGTRTITATQRDLGGNLSAPSAPRQFTVASVPTVTLTTPTPINASNAMAYPVAGSCTTAAGNVSLTVGTVMASAPCTAGAFSAMINATSVPDSLAVALVAAQTNPSGTGNDTRNALKDTQLPGSPTFTRPADQAIINDTTPSLTGTAEPGSTVKVTRGTTVICTTVTPPTGLWSCVSSTLPDGQVSLTSTATDPAGNESAPSMPRTFTIDTTAPAAPTIAAPAEGMKVGLSPMLSGTAEPFATITVNEGSAIVCQATASMTGSWSCPSTLGAGTHSVTARQTDRSGNQGQASAPRSFLVESIPTVILSTPQVINKARAARYEVSGFCTTSAGPVTLSVGSVMGTAPCMNGLFSTTLDVSAIADGSMIPIRASQTTAGGTGTDSKTVLKDTQPPDAPQITLPTLESVITTGRPMMSGKAEPNSTVTIIINGQEAGTAQTDANGNWTFTPPTQLADGRYEVKAHATDAAGNVGPDTVQVPFNVDSTAPKPPVIITPARNAELDVDRDFEISGTSEPGARVTVYLDGEPKAFVVADAEGRWKTPVPANVLQVGPHVASAEALDTAGNRGTRAEDVPFTIRKPELRYAGQGLFGCSSAGFEAMPLLLGVLAMIRRRRSSRGVATRAVLALSVMASLVATSAWAQDPTPLPGFSLTRFSLNDAPLGGLGAATGDLLPARKFRASIAFHYENNPLVLFRDNQRQGALVGNRLNLHVSASYGITSFLTANLELPFVLYQGGDDLTQAAHVLSPDSFGLASPRLSVRLGIMSQRKGGLLADAPVDLAFQLGTAFPFGVGNALAVESGWNVFPQLSAGRDFGPVRFGGEIVGLIRPSAVTLSNGSVVRDQIGSQLGLRALLSSTGDGVRFEGSFHTLVPLGGEQTPAGFELLGGVRAPLGPVELFLLVGPGFGSLPGTPTVRVLGGVALRADDACSSDRPHTPSQCPDLDDDRDGVANGVDKCALDPEDIDQFRDDDGCPDPDNDGDGVLDGDDKCPLKKGPLANQGCPVTKVVEIDTDKDGITDAKDECPTEAGPPERNGCPVKDRDGDGVEDPQDKCPDEPGPKEREGCPLKDKDGDGVEDQFDNCPEDKGPASNQGCPEKDRQLVVITKEKLVIMEKVYFATAKATILARSFPLLNNVARVLRDHPEIQLIRVEGHTDSQGARDYNVGLSQRRANSVKDYLIHQGVDGTRLQAKGFGPDRPADTNKTDAGRSNNRRVEFVIRNTGSPEETE